MHKYEYEIQSIDVIKDINRKSKPSRVLNSIQRLYTCNNILCDRRLMVQCNYHFQRQLNTPEVSLLVYTCDWFCAFYASTLYPCDHHIIVYTLYKNVSIINLNNSALDDKTIIIRNLQCKQNYPIFSIFIRAINTAFTYIRGATCD